MANYSISINSKFKPFSYAEMLAPVKAMTDEHQKIDEQYSVLAAEAAKWENLANEQSEPYAYNMYKKYASELALAADDLARNGLTAASRQSLYNMKARYNAEIDPIVQAYNRRAADIKRQQDISDKSGDRTVFTRKAGEISLDDYINNQTPEWHQANLDTIRDEGMAAGKAFSSRYFDTKEGNLFNGAYWDLRTTNGLNHKQAIAALSRSGAYPEFDRFINEELRKTRADQFNDIDRRSIVDAVMQGLNLGITYKEDHKPEKNWIAEQQMSHRLAMARQAAANPTPTPTTPQPPKGAPGKTVPIIFSNPEVGKNLGLQRQSEIAWQAIVDAAQKGDKDAKDIYDFWTKTDKNGKFINGGANAAIKKWSTEGFDGNVLRSKKQGGKSKYEYINPTTGKQGVFAPLYYKIGNAFRANGITNENLINLWRSPYWPDRGGKDWSTFITTDPKTGNVSSRHVTLNPFKEGYSSEYSKNHIYQGYGIALNLTETQTGHFLNKALTRNYATENKLRLYDIKSWDSITNEINYSSSYTNADAISRDSNGNIQMNKAVIIVLPNKQHDYLIQWLDKDGKQVQKVLKRADVSLEAQNDLSTFYKSNAAAAEMYPNYRDESASDHAHYNAATGFNFNKFLEADYGTATEIVEDYKYEFPD